VILASLRSPIPKITLVGDTSGSMSGDQLALIRGTISDVCSSLGAVLAFLSVDAAVHGQQSLSEGASAMMVGRGGTDMTVGIQHAIEKTNPDAVVVATDCATPWPAERPRVPVIVAAVEAPEECIQEVPRWAKVVRVERVSR
jgi:predicted metal-dependent peptidase